MMDSKNTFSSQSERERARDVIRRYLEGDASSRDIKTIQVNIHSSESWRREYEKMEEYLSQLHALPQPQPPERIWEKIQESIGNKNPQTVWYPWFYAQPAWGLTLKILPVLILLALFLGVGNNLWIESQYDFIVVEEANGLGVEAESYAVYHDLANEPLPIRESLVAFSTNIGNK